MIFVLKKREKKTCKQAMLQNFHQKTPTQIDRKRFQKCIPLTVRKNALLMSRVFVLT